MLRLVYIFISIFIFFYENFKIDTIETIGALSQIFPLPFDRSLTDCNFNVIITNLHSTIDSEILIFIFI